MKKNSISLILFIFMFSFVINFSAISVCAQTTKKAVSNQPQTSRKYTEEEAAEQRKKRKKEPFNCGYVRPIKVGGYVTNPPFGWVDIIPLDGPRGDIYQNDGFSFILFQKMAQEMGLQTQNVGFKSYRQAVQALKEGKIDVLTGSYYDRSVLGVGTQLLFPGYFKNPVIAVFLKGKEKPVLTFNDLVGLKGVVRQEEMIYSLMFNALPQEVDITRVSGARRAYTMLLNGEVDYVITSLYAAEAEVRRFKIVDEVIFTEHALIEPELFFILASNSDCAALSSLFSQKLKEKLQKPEDLRKLVISQIDAWGFRFADMPSLPEEINSRATQSVNEIVEPMDGEVEDALFEPNEDLQRLEELAEEANKAAESDNTPIRYMAPTTPADQAIKYIQ